MRFLITTIGSSGDINPFIAVGRALRSRGHEVAVMVNPHFARQVEDAGLTFLPLSEEWDLKNIAQTPGAMHHTRGALVVMRELLFVHIPEIVERTRAAVREWRPDAALTHAICYGAPWVFREAGVPYAVGTLQPSIWFSKSDPSVFSPWSRDRPSRWGAALQTALFRLATPLVFDRPLHRARRELGFPRLEHPFVHDFRGGRINLGLWSPLFRAPQPDDPPRAVTCGFPWHDRRAELEGAAAGIEAFLDEGEPPILFTLGSAAVHLSGAFYQHAADACAALGRRGLLLTGLPEYAPRRLPAGVRAFPYAPFSRVMPRACATVHHGGIGTTGQALRAGRPTVVVPFAHDQFDNAARVRRLGVSRTVAQVRLTPHRLTEALGQVLGDAGAATKARELGAQVGAEDGAAVAAGHLERWAGNAQPEPVPPRGRS
jgi:rhamnosyltransferase subunit B